LGNTFQSLYSRQKKIGKRVPKFKFRAKKEIREGKKRWGEGREKVSLHPVRKLLKFCGSLGTIGDLL
jgi:hypothetical protein